LPSVTKPRTADTRGTPNNFFDSRQQGPESYQIKSGRPLTQSFAPKASFKTEWFWVSSNAKSDPIQLLYEISSILSFVCAWEQTMELERFTTQNDNTVRDMKKKDVFKNESM